MGRFQRQLRYPVARAAFRSRLAFAHRPPTRRLLRLDRRASSAPIHLVSVAFDNVEIVGAQIQMLRRWVTDPFALTVADNSPSSRSRRAIRAICRAAAVGYVSLPRNPYTGRDPSISHGEALNYVCRHLPELGAADVVGFLDHDVFPTRELSLRSAVGEAPVYGRVIATDSGWYVWPGLMFVRPAVIDVRRLDFRPLWGFGDTGSRMFATIYSHLDARAIPQTSCMMRTFTVQDQMLEVEMHDSWMHVRSASGWRGCETRNDLILATLRTLGLHDEPSFA